MTVALGNVVHAVGFRKAGALLYMTGVRAQAHRAALPGNALLAFHQINDAVGAFRVKFAGIGILIAQNLPRIADDSNLHPKTDAKIRNALHARVIGGTQHPFNAAPAEAAGQDHPIRAGQVFVHVCFIHLLRIDPIDIHKDAVFIAAVPQRLRNREICIMQPDIFADQGNFDMSPAVLDAFQHVPPVGKVAARISNRQLAADDIGKMAFLQHQRGLVKHRKRAVFNHAIGRDAAKHGDFMPDFSVHGTIHPRDNHIGADAHAAQLLHRVLGRLAFRLVRARNIRHQRHMNKQAAAPSDLNGNLPDGL